MVKLIYMIKTVVNLEANKSSLVIVKIHFKEQLLLLLEINHTILNILEINFLSFILGTIDLLF